MFILIQKNVGMVKVSYQLLNGSGSSISQISRSSLSSYSDLNSSLIGLNLDTTRQYVPLVVICAVIIDILCGSPLANLLLAPLRRATQSQEDRNTDLMETSESRSPELLKTGNGSRVNPDSRERIDSVAVAQAALDKARNSMELRRYLDENKTDKDRMDDLRKKIDSQLRELSE
jgi:hypothetical protein